MITTKVFKQGNSQAVRLPKAFRFDVDEVHIRREGETVVPIPKPVSRWGMDTLIAAHATSLDATLVTHHQNAFSRVPGWAPEEIGPRGSGGHVRLLLGCGGLSPIVLGEPRWP